MADALRIVGFSGSLREASLNSAVLRELVGLAPEGMRIDIADYRAVPLYNPDLGEVAVVETLKEQVGAADGVLIVTPEYNHSLPGALKNVLDWLSRPAYRSVFAHRPTGILSAAPGPIGGARAQAHLKAVLAGMAAPVFPHPEIAIGMGNERIRDGRIVAADTRELLQRYLAGFAGWVRRERGSD